LTLRERKREKERELLPQLGDYESRNENWYGLENEKEEKADKKTNIIDSKTWQYHTYSVIGESRRLVGRRRDSVAKAINDDKAAPCQLDELKRHNHIMEFTLLRTSKDSLQKRLKRF